MRRPREMDDGYTAFWLRDCRRCGDPVLTGRAYGVEWKIDTRTIPLADAITLTRYGHAVLKLDPRASGLWADGWCLAEFRPGQLLAVQHSCGSDHATRRTPPTAS